MWRVLGRGGSRLALFGALLAAACDEGSAVSVGTAPPTFGIAGAANGFGGSTIAGLAGNGFGGSATTQERCSGSPPFNFPVRRYSVADIDNSLDLVFGAGSPRLEELLANDAGYDRTIGPRLVEALLEVARARVKTAAAEAARLAVCEAESDDADGCVQGWLRRYGDQLYRRPLQKAQIEAYSVPFLGAETEESRVNVAENALAAMVLSPYFVLRLEVGSESGHISAYDVASRLAHLATRRIPDASLRDRAASGEIFDPVVRLTELHRLWRTPAGRAARELQVLEWLGIPSSPTSEVQTELAEDMLAQARAFISRVYDEENGAFPALFSSSRLPLNDRLAEHYGLPLPSSQALESLELDRQLFAGLLSTGAFLSRYPRPSQRGRALMSSLLCVGVPDPPVLGHDAPPPPAETPRLSLQAALGVDGKCVACHQTIDPPGFALEAFDDEGRLTGFATHGAVALSPTDKPFPVSGPVALGEAITGSYAAQDCLARRSLEYVSQSSLGDGFFPRLVAPEVSAGEAWRGCLISALSAPTPSLTVLMETVAQSELMVTRDDQPRRVVALDTNEDPIEHAYQETRQLRGAYSQVDDVTVQQYEQALVVAQSLSGPQGDAGAGGEAGDAGAGGEAGDAGAGGEAGDAGAGGAP